MDVPNDVWVLTNANGMNGQPEWIQLLPKGAAPAARQNFAMAYDQAANSVVLFGGCCPSLNDQWILKNANGLGGSPKWQQLSPAQPPAPRQNNGSFGYDVGGDYDPTKLDYNAGTNSLILFGGLGYNPSGTVYNDVWFLADAVPKSGSPVWFNLIPNGSSFPPPSVPPGVYDGAFTSLSPYVGGSKRLMTFPDASDLWILTTRNAIDISCSADPGKFDPSVLTQIQQAGIQYVVVKVPQTAASNCPPRSGIDGIKRAQEQLDDFSKFGSGSVFKTAGYCLLLFEKPKTGSTQANNCLKALDPSRYASTAFMALDVEGKSKISQSDAFGIVQDAMTTIENALGSGKPVVIYTTPYLWDTIIGTAGKFSKQPPLWARLGTNFYDADHKLHCGDGVPSLTPFSQVGGWTVLRGKQFDLGLGGCGSSTFLAGVPVDFDVLDASLFPQ